MELTEEYAAGKEGTHVTPGRYVMIAITDTGHGMERQTLGRVFEPFFTTKAVGRGSGLGLSTVYGIVKQCNGFIWAYSEPGLGTTFKTYLPLAQQAPQPEAEPATPLRSKGGETVLLVEDEPMVRRVIGRALREFGYAVEEVANGREALEWLESSGGANLIITDLVMPEMGGAKSQSTWRDGIPICRFSSRRATPMARRCGGSWSMSSAHFFKSRSPRTFSSDGSASFSTRPETRCAPHSPTR